MLRLRVTWRSIESFIYNEVGITFHTQRTPLVSIELKFIKVMSPRWYPRWIRWCNVGCSWRQVIYSIWTWIQDLFWQYLTVISSPWVTFDNNLEFFFNDLYLFSYDQYLMPGSTFPELDSLLSWRISKVKQFKFDGKFGHGIFKCFEIKFIYLETT